MAKIPPGTARTSLTLRTQLWLRFQASTAVLGMTDRAGVEEALQLWLDEHAASIAVSHRRAANEAEGKPEGS